MARVTKAQLDQLLRLVEAQGGKVGPPTRLPGMPDRGRGKTTGAKRGRPRTRKVLPLIDPAVRYGDGWVELDVPLKADSRANVDSHGAWQARHNRVQVTHQTLGNMLCIVPVEVRMGLAGGCRVTLTRVAPRKLDPDNLPTSLKAYRDGLTVWMVGGRMGQRDNRDEIKWDCQETSRGDRYGVLVRIEVAR